MWLYHRNNVSCHKTFVCTALFVYYVAPLKMVNKHISQHSVQGIRPCYNEVRAYSSHQAVAVVQSSSAV